MSEEKSSSDYQFEGSESYRGGSSDKFTIKETVMRQLRKVMEEGSKEMSAGGVTKRLIDGNVYSFFTPNQRKMFCNACDMLSILILPEIRKHPKVVEDLLKEYDSKLKGIENIKETRVQMIEKEFSSKGNKDEYVKSRNQKIEEVWNQFEFDKVGLYKSLLLPAISLLLASINYFEEEGYTGGELVEGEEDASL